MSERAVLASPNRGVSTPRAVGSPRGWRSAANVRGMAPTWICIPLCIFASFMAFGNNARKASKTQLAQQQWGLLRSLGQSPEVGNVIAGDVASHQDAIVYLTGKDIYRPSRTNCPSLLHSLGSIARHFPVPDANSVPVIIVLSDVNLDNTTQAKIRQASPFPVQFYMDVSFTKTIDEPKHIPGDQSEFDKSYKRMCAFWFKYFFELDFLPQYVMRMDTDSCITSDIPTNPFVTMRERGIDYMYHSTFREPRRVIQNLQKFTNKYPGSPRTDHDNDVNAVFHKDKAIGNMRAFSTNVEWFYMPAFRRPEILEWQQLVMKSNGIYKYRWGDAPLRTITATKFFNSTAVARFCNFSYSHSAWKPYLPCDPRSDIHAKPARKFKRTLESGKVVESTFGWKNV